MLRDSQYILRQASILLDLAMALAAFFLAHLIRRVLMIYVLPGLQPATLADYLWLLPFTPVAAVVALAWAGVYRDSWVRLPMLHLAGRIAAGCLAALLLLMAVEVIVHPPVRTTRAFLLILPFCLFLLVMGRAGVLRRVLQRIRASGSARRVVLVGSGPPLREVADSVAGHPIWGFHIVGIITDRPEFQAEGFAPHAVPEAQLGYPVLSDLGEAPSCLWRITVDEVILTPGAVPPTQLHPLMEACEEMGLRTHVPLNFFSARIARPVVDRFEQMPVVSYWPTRPMGPALFLKHALDRIAGALLMVVLAPVMVCIAAAIRWQSPGHPALFRQTRCGLNGRPFTLFKFRTMDPDAERRRTELEEQSEQDGPAFKMSRDPRVTPFGHFLRRHSLDELPQLWNVVRGEMSLVGPRPPLASEVVRYDRWQRRRLSMKPGLTCLWQVSGRNRLLF